MTDAATWARIGDEEFVELTTFRRSGAPVRTPVWVARDGDDLVVTTPADSGKVSRLRHTPDVQMRPCSRRGTVAPGAPTIRGVAGLEEAPPLVDAGDRVLRAKYGFQYTVFMALEKVLRRRDPRRVILRIRAAG